MLITILRKHWQTFNHERKKSKGNLVHMSNKRKKGINTEAEKKKS